MDLYKGEKGILKRETEIRIDKENGIIELPNTKDIQNFKNKEYESFFFEYGEV